MDNKKFNIYINNKQKEYKILKNEWKKFVKQVCANIDYIKKLKNDTVEIGITFVNDEEIRKLNTSYKSKDNPTDVLAFEYDNQSEFLPLSESFHLGDVVISVDTARMQAEDLNHDIKKELQILTIHGILHLTGYDDLAPKAKTRMFKMQDKLLEQTGT